MKSKHTPKQSTGRGIYSTLAAAAFELATSRETLRRRLVQARIEPRRTTKGRDEYLLRDILRAWYADAERDPARMHPFARRAHFQAQHEEIRLAEKSGQLVSYDDVRREFSLTFQWIANAIGSLPDVVERVGVPVEAVVAIEEALRATKRELFARLSVPELSEPGAADARPRQ